MSEVFVCEVGQLTAASKREMKKAGIVVAEVADLTKCQFVRAGEAIAPDALLWSAINALALSASFNDGDKQRARFVNNVESILRASVFGKGDAEESTHG